MCSVVILRPSMLWCSSLLPIDSTVDYKAPLTHAVTIHCNRSGILSYKAGSEQNVPKIFKFSALSTLTSGYSLFNNRLTCFKNGVSDISCFLNVHHVLSCRPEISFLQYPGYKDFLCLRIGQGAKISKACNRPDMFSESFSMDSCCQQWMSTWPYNSNIFSIKVILHCLSFVINIY